MDPSLKASLHWQMVTISRLQEMLQFHPNQNKDDTMEIDEDEDFDYHPPTKEEVERFEARRKKQDEISKRIGDKLLAGWAMLDLVCPKGECGTVLMRDRSKKMWCLACNTMVITEDEFDATKHRIVTNTEVIANTGNQNSKTPASQGMATAPVQQPEPARNQIPIIQQIPELQQLLQQPQQIPVQQQASLQQQFAVSTETDIVKYAVSTLFNKLKQVSTQLACTNDPVMCAHYANAIKEISIALANLQQLRSTL